jgi:hypothetical protein
MEKKHFHFGTSMPVRGGSVHPIEERSDVAIHKRLIRKPKWMALNLPLFDAPLSQRIMRLS